MKNFGEISVDVICFPIDVVTNFAVVIPPFAFCQTIAIVKISSIQNMTPIYRSQSIGMYQNDAMREVEGRCVVSTRPDLCRLKVNAEILQEKHSSRVNHNHLCLSDNDVAPFPLQTARDARRR